MATERLDRLLGHMGLGSRRAMKDLVRQGRVMVDGVVAADPGIQVDPEGQRIIVDGQVLRYQRHYYVLLHKPPGVITATEDPRKQTVLDVLPEQFRLRGLFPVGRLDKDTEGLLLLTTDGELAHRLLAPRWHVDKRYYARVDADLSPDDVRAFATGIPLAEDLVCMPARLELAGPREAYVTIQEGKYHQVKRMFAACGKQVIYLKRLQMGPLDLGDLVLGEARFLTEEEMASLGKATGLARP